MKTILTIFSIIIILAAFFSVILPVLLYNAAKNYSSLDFDANLLNDDESLKLNETEDYRKFINEQNKYSDSKNILNNNDGK